MCFCLTNYILSNFICGAMCRRSWSCGCLVPPRYSTVSNYVSFVASGFFTFHMHCLHFLSSGNMFDTFIIHSHALDFMNKRLGH